MSDIVFISYTRNDSELAIKLASFLETHKFEVWLDINKIQNGKNIDEKISDGLNKSTSMIVLLSESSYSSTYVRNEIQYALLNNKLQNRILPVFIKDKDSIDYDKLPWILRKLNFLVIDNKKGLTSNVELIYKEFFQMIRGE